VEQTVSYIEMNRSCFTRISRALRMAFEHQLIMFGMSGLEIKVFTLS